MAKSSSFNYVTRQIAREEIKKKTLFVLYNMFFYLSNFPISFQRRVEVMFISQMFSNGAVYEMYKEQMNVIFN